MRRKDDPKAYQRWHANAHGNRLRQLAHAALGSQCVRCAASGPPGFLDVDHINGAGAEDKAGRRKTSVWLLAGRAVRDEGALAAQKKYQLLCPNCHRIKTLTEKRAGNPWNVA